MCVCVCVCVCVHVCDRKSRPKDRHTMSVSKAFTKRSYVVVRFGFPGPATKEGKCEFVDIERVDLCLDRVSFCLLISLVFLLSSVRRAVSCELDRAG
jgi:hypothetical protein